MNRSTKIFVGFVAGAIILGTIGFFLAPSLLGLAGVLIGNPAMQYTAVTSTLPVIIGTKSAVIGVTATVFGHLEAGITILAGLIGGLTGGLIGVGSSKAKDNCIQQQYASLSPAGYTSKAGTGEYSPSLDFDGQNTGKSFVESYRQEKLENLQPPTQWHM